MHSIALRICCHCSWGKHGAHLVLSAPDGPHVGPMNLAIRGYCVIKMYEKPTYLDQNILSFIAIQFQTFAITKSINMVSYWKCRRETTSQDMSICLENSTICFGIISFPLGNILPIQQRLATWVKKWNVSDRSYNIATSQSKTWSYIFTTHYINCPLWRIHESVLVVIIGVGITLTSKN